MNRPELFERTVQVLVDAYENKHLHSMSCAACTVGNLIAAANQFTICNGVSWIDSNGEKVKSTNDWLSSIIDFRGGIAYSYDKSRANELISSTGYSVAELSRIEKAFETTMSDRRTLYFGVDPAIRKKAIVKDQRYGLEAVYNVLLKIHEADDMLFVKQAAFVPIEEAV